MSHEDSNPENAAKHRLQPLSDANWPPEIASLMSGFAGGLNVYRTLANHPDLLRSWTDIREHVVNRTSLGLTRNSRTKRTRQP